MRFASILVIAILVSCSSPQDKIIVPEIQAGFYADALQQIEEELSKESTLSLVEKKLYYCDQLNWPSTCITALDELKKQKGMTPQLLRQYINYYKLHGRYEELLGVIERWASGFDLEREFVQERISGLSHMSRVKESKSLLRGYMLNKDQVEDFRFAARNYLMLKDSIMASYYLGKVAKVNPTDQMIYDHLGYILLNFGYTNEGLEILESYSKMNPDDFEFHKNLSSIYKELQRFGESRNALKNFTSEDTVIYEIADSFVKEAKWDSAHQYIDIIIDRDSVDKKAWWTKARMYEDQGWLSYSLNYFDHVIYLDPQDSIAIERAQSVRRKIAYLLRQKFEESKVAPPVIESKKINNNE